MISFWTEFNGNGLNRNGSKEVELQRNWTSSFILFPDNVRCQRKRWTFLIVRTCRAKRSHMTPFLLLGISWFQLATFVDKYVWQSELDKYLKLAQISSGRVIFLYMHACRYWSHIYIHTCMHNYYMYAHYMHACMHRAYIHQSLPSCISPSCTACSPASLSFFLLSLAFLPPSLSRLSHACALCLGQRTALAIHGFSVQQATLSTRLFAKQPKRKWRRVCLRCVVSWCCHLSILSTLAPLIRALVQ